MSDLGAIFHVKKAGVQYDAHAYTTTDECPEPNLKIKFKGLGKEQFLQELYSSQMESLRFQWE